MRKLIVSAFLTLHAVMQPHATWTRIERAVSSRAGGRRAAEVSIGGRKA
jgi:hypothetical protein